LSISFDFTSLQPQIFKALAPVSSNACLQVIDLIEFFHPKLSLILKKVIL